MNNKNHDLTIELISDLFDTKLAQFKKELLAEVNDRTKELEQLKQWKVNAKRILDDSVLEKPNLFRKLMELKFDRD